MLVGCNHRLSRMQAQQQPEARLSVPDALVAMQTAVRSGEMQQVSWLCNCSEAAVAACRVWLRRWCVQPLPHACIEESAAGCCSSLCS